MISFAETLFRWTGALRPLLALGLALSASPVAAVTECPDQYDFGPGQINYHDPDPAVQSRIRGIESNHMNQDVRSLRRGQSTHLSGDLKFVIGIVPNHPEALELLTRLAIRERTDKLPETQPYPVTCWLRRATVFSPDDSKAWLLYGVYLSRRGEADKAIPALERANELRPDDPNVTYNLGLMYFEGKDYARSLEFAKKAYAAGFPLPGLKKKLERAGQWRD